MRSSPVGSEKGLIFSGGGVDGLGEVRVSLDGLGEGDRDGVLPTKGEVPAVGLATATGELSTDVDGVGAVDVGVRPHADKTITSPTSAAKTLWRLVSGPTLSGGQV